MVRVPPTGHPAAVQLLDGRLALPGTTSGELPPALAVRATWRTASEVAPPDSETSPAAPACGSKGGSLPLAVRLVDPLQRSSWCAFVLLRENRQRPYGLSQSCTCRVSGSVGIS